MKTELPHPLLKWQTMSVTSSSSCKEELVGEETTRRLDKLWFSLVSFSFSPSNISKQKLTIEVYFAQELKLMQFETISDTNIGRLVWNLSRLLNTEVPTGHDAISRSLAHLFINKSICEVNLFWCSQAYKMLLIINRVDTIKGIF